MTNKELTAAFEEKLVPLSLAESWDNPGLLVGCGEREIRHVYVALDAGSAQIEKAAALGCDMIVTHHPMIFSSFKSVTTEDFTGRRIVRLIREGIDLYAMHTNFDVAVMGDLCAAKIPYLWYKPLQVTGERDGSPAGIGTVGELNAPMTLKALADLVRQRFDLPQVRFYGDPELSLLSVAMCPGSGKSLMADVLAQGAGVYITGDVDHHFALDALEQGVAVIDAGHHGLEHLYVPFMAGWLNEYFPDLKVSADDNCSPFQTI